MTTGQLLLTILGLFIAIFGASWLNTHQIDKRLEEMNKRIDEKFDSLRREIKSDINRLESDIKSDIKHLQADVSDVKSDIKRIFKPIIPG